ncbi:MAG: family transcriptional regulator, partial [Verrucomicrobiales bacterium]|nr:family transcriptional regulator [Verrucomicrobiales bacterium]
MKTALDFKALPKSYTELLKIHMVRPIHDKVALENALEVLDAMAGHKLNAEQEDYFEALSSLVEVYERQHLPEPNVSGLSLLRHLIEANGLTGADLSRLLGRDRSLGVRILNGERQLT